jgi:hypothetical protein
VKTSSRDVERLRSLIAEAVKASKKPQGASEMARRGADTRHRLFKLIERFEAETGQDGIFFADTVEANGRMFVHPEFVELIRKGSDGALLEPALWTAFTTPEAVRLLNEGWPSTVEKYRGQPNTEELISEKSAALTVFVTNNLDLTMAIYAAEHKEGPELNDQQVQQIKIEEAALWFRIVDELAHRYLGPRRPLFMDNFEDDLAHILALQGTPPNVVCDTLANRMAEYGPYRRWIAEAGEGTGGTLLWEAAKHIANPFGSSCDPFFLLNFGMNFLKRMREALVYELLTGQTRAR